MRLSRLHAGAPRAARRHNGGIRWMRGGPERVMDPPPTGAASVEASPMSCDDALGDRLFELHGSQLARGGGPVVENSPWTLVYGVASLGVSGRGSVL